MPTPLTARGRRDRGVALPLGLAALVAVGLALGQPVAVAVPVPEPPAGGLVILDNCDPEFNGKDTYGDHLSLIDAAGKVPFRVVGFNNAEGIGGNRRVAVDSARGWIWTLEDAAQRVRKFDRAGKELLALRNLQANALAVDPETGNLWVLTSQGTIYGHKTVVYSPEGKQLAVHDLGGYDLAYDRKAKAFWIAERKLTKVAVARGEVVCSVAVSTWCASSVDVDPRSGAAWVAVREHSQVPGSSNRLLKFDADGKAVAAIDLGEKCAFQVSVDPKDGSAWVAHWRKSVGRYSAEGKSVAEHAADALAVQADAAGGSAWVVTSTDVRKMTPGGDVPLRVNHAGKTSQVWIATLE